MPRPNQPFVDSLNTKEGAIRAKYVTISNGRVRVLVGAATEGVKLPYTPGAVFVRNLDLAKRTNGNTEWMVYEAGLYEAWRAGGHIDRNGNGLQNGELQELLEHREAAREYVYAILNPELLDAKSMQRHQEVFAAIAVQLGPSRNVRKAIAQTHLQHAQRLEDRTGRHNPGAAAMRVGTGIGQLDLRSEDVQAILRRVGWRTFHLYHALQDSMGIYQIIRAHLNIKRRNGMPYKNRLAYLVLERMQPQSEDTVLNILAGLKQLRSEPFRKNRYHTEADFQQALEGIRLLGSKRGDDAVKQLQDIVFKRIQQGITWVFARDYLEMQVLAPLSWHMEEVDRRIRSNGSVHVTPDETQKFDALVLRLREFRDKVTHCEDSLLKHPVKEDILLQTDEALEFTRAQDWEEVKRLLKGISQSL
ncbi:hypothetical protein GF380_05715 [Candidatus Uhrbacteria bacterium]|nr:hypothetical protein [Candidatus Uhrbacteria bacterium]MBD3284498.1 hypothetical protein [Candidatus Uhrbacteria bacterium]